MKSYYIIWQDQTDRRWWPVGKLVRTSKWYVFFYTHGAKQAANFIPFPGMTKMDNVYISGTIFPFLSNRLLNKNRPDFQKYAVWSGLDVGLGDPMAIMAATGGARATDTLQVYEVPSKTVEEKYETIFFLHGLSHLPRAAQDLSFTMQKGDTLFPMLDPQNPFDREAVALRTNDPAMMIGYCPRHMCFDVRDLLNNYGEKISIQVEKVNIDAPTQFRLLIRASSKWPNDFKPCNRPAYKTLINEQKLLRQIQSLT